jgi:integrase
MLKVGQGKGLSFSSVAGMRRVLRAALNDAIREGLISTNAAALAKMPAIAKAPKAMVWTDKRVAEWEVTGEKPGPVMVWTPQQFGTFLDAIAEDPLYALFHLIGFRGLRRGEACAVEWDDFDWDAKTLTITRQLITTGGKRIEGRPKSDAGSRVISLEAGTIEVLKRHRLASISTPPVHGHDKKVFRTRRGYTLDPNKITRTFLRLSCAADLPPIRLHDLRHVAASLLHASGADMKVIQETLGHSTVVLTANTYTSLFPEVAHEAAERAAAIVPRAHISIA